MLGLAEVTKDFRGGTDLDQLLPTRMNAPQSAGSTEAAAAVRWAFLREFCIELPFARCL